MNAELLKRLFRAIGQAPTSELERLCDVVIEEEKKKGHETLARQLSRIRESSRPSPEAEQLRSLSPLTKSKRSSELLVSFKPPEILRHHMVLASEVERRFHRVEREYAARDRLNRHGFVHRRRVLLYGAPGCGKSLGAERLAWNTGLPFYRVRFDTLISSVFGESASNLRRVFEMAAERPCLLFLDECDFIARSRKATNDVGEIPRIVNTLLQLMEDYEGSGLIVAATNLTEALDEALFRRFDEVLEVPLPGHVEILKLLQQTIAPLGSQKLDFSEVASKLEGQSAATIVKVAQDACKTVILQGSNAVSSAELIAAIEEQYQTVASAE